MKKVLIALALISVVFSGCTPNKTAEPGTSDSTAVVDSAKTDSSK